LLEARSEEQPPRLLLVFLFLLGVELSVLRAAVGSSREALWAEVSRRDFLLSELDW